MAQKLCALIRQTWYEAAKRNLKPEERVRFYEMCLEFEFYGNEPDEDAPFASRLLFDMVKNDLESDRTRAKERSERNRLNGLRGGRPKITTDNTQEENPQKASGFLGKPIYTEQNNTEQNRTKESDDSNETEDSHMFFSVCMNFFDRGTADAVGEATKFWNYYAALGWKTAGGGAVVDKLALARAWRLPDISKAAIRSRLAYSTFLHKSGATETALISDFVSMVRDNSKKVVTLGLVNRATAMLIERKYLKYLAEDIPQDENGQKFGLTYTCAQGELAV